MDLGKVAVDVGADKGGLGNAVFCVYVGMVGNHRVGLVWDLVAGLVAGLVADKVAGLVADKVAD